VFDLDRRTGGRPLYAVTMALFEEEGLFVSDHFLDGSVAPRLCRGPARGALTPPRPPQTPSPHPQDDWLLDRATTSAYLRACERTYRAQNPYHNNTHAADVTQTAACLLRAFSEAAAAAAADGTAAGSKKGTTTSSPSTPPPPPDKLERFCVLLASAVHDLGHPGVNNDFLVRTRHRLAGLYNDRSVNEHYHCATAFHLAHSVVVGAEGRAGGGGGKVAAEAGPAGAAAPSARRRGAAGDLGDGAHRPLTDLIGAPPTLQRAAADDGQGGPAALLPAHAAVAKAASAAASPAASPTSAIINDGGIFSRFPLDEYTRARQLVVDMVLSTDMAVHFDLLASFRAAREREAGRSPVLWSSSADRALAFQMLVHLSDLANPARPFPLALRWAERVVSEFLAQGEAEVASGVAVSAMCDREKVSMPRAQLNFVSIFLRPTLDAAADAVPSWAAAARTCLDDTVRKWEWLEDGGGVRLPRSDGGLGVGGVAAYPSLPAELEASRPWEAAAVVDGVASARASAAANGSNGGAVGGKGKGAAAANGR
jgi:hypothetical protein